jgi:hypothetical protein
MNVKKHTFKEVKPIKNLIAILCTVLIFIFLGGADYQALTMGN